MRCGAIGESESGGGMKIGGRREEGGGGREGERREGRRRAVWCWTIGRR
jgi:hypothetical protein